MLLLKEKEYCKNLRSSFELSDFVVAVENKSHREAILNKGIGNTHF